MAFADVVETPEFVNTRAKVLRTAEKYVNGDRNAQYGEPWQDFSRSAAMISAYLGYPIAPHEVAVIMCLLKLSRIKWSPEKDDSWIDLAGYAACGYDTFVAVQKLKETQGVSNA